MMIPILFHKTYVLKIKNLVSEVKKLGIPADFPPIKLKSVSNN